jgi:hypothetical protein
MIADVSDLERELTWCRETIASLKEAMWRTDDKNVWKGIDAIMLALAGTRDAYEAFSKDLRLVATMAQRRPDLLRKKLSNRADMMPLMAARGRAMLQLANAPALANQGEMIFERIAIGELLLRRLVDTTTK